MKKLDIYILKNFILTLIYSIIALYFIFIIVTLMENLDDFIDENVAFSKIVEYYIYYFPEIIKLITPVGMLLATLFSIGRLANLNEVTAMKSGGMSLYRLMMPIATISILLSFGQLYFNGWVVPDVVEKKNTIEREDLKKNRKTTAIYNLYLRDDPNTNLSMQYYSSKGYYGRKISLERFEGEMNPRMIEHIEALNIRWQKDEENWKFEKGIIRKFTEDGVESENFEELVLELNINHDQLIKLKKETEEMTFTELRNYIKVMQVGGKDVRRMMIDYYGEWAFPFANLIIVLFGVPFASVRKKGGMAVQIGAALVVSFTYLIFTEISKTIGYSSGLDPVYIGWSANVFFTGLGLTILFTTKT